MGNAIFTVINETLPQPIAEEVVPQVRREFELHSYPFTDDRSRSVKLEDLVDLFGKLEDFDTHKIATVDHGRETRELEIYENELVFSISTRKGCESWMFSADGSCNIVYSYETFSVPEEWDFVPRDLLELVREAIEKSSL